MWLLPFQWDSCKINWHQHCSWSGKSAFPWQKYYKQGNKAEKKGEGDDCCAMLRRSVSWLHWETICFFLHCLSELRCCVLTVVNGFWIEQDNHFLFLTYFLSNYSYPQCTLTDEETRTEMINRELQISQREKQEILAFEGHLAAASTKQTITESSSLLLSQLTSLDPQ